MLWPVTVTSQCYTKTAKRSNTETMPYDSPGTLLGWLVGVERPFSAKYGYIRDKRSRVESYPYPVKEG